MQYQIYHPMSRQNKIYPGLICNALEFFHDGYELRVLSGGILKSFRDLPYYFIQLIREKIAERAEVETELMRMHPDSEMKRIEQYAICNFSGLDYEPDIIKGVLQEGEYWDCPKRGICPGEGKICKQLTYNGHTISFQEIRMIKLLVTDMTNEVMAETLFLPMGTFHKIKKNLYQKLDVYTKQEIALIAIGLNII